MTRQVTQNLLRTGLDGSVQAVFPGGVLIQERPNMPPFPNPDNAHTVSWTRGLNGAMVAQLMSYNLTGPGGQQGNISWFANTTPNGLGSGELDLIAGAPGNVTSMVRASALQGGTFNDANIVDAYGQSDFFQSSCATAITCPVGFPHNIYTGVGFTVPRRVKRMIFLVNSTFYSTGANTAFNLKLYLDGFQISATQWMMNQANVHTNYAGMVGASDTIYTSLNPGTVYTLALGVTVQSGPGVPTYDVFDNLTMVFIG